MPAMAKTCHLHGTKVLLSAFDIFYPLHSELPVESLMCQLPTSLRDDIGGAFSAASWSKGLLFVMCCSEYVNIRNVLRAPHLRAKIRSWMGSGNESSCEPLSLVTAQRKPREGYPRAVTNRHVREIIT